MLSNSGWEKISVASNIFFLVGCILVGIGSLGRLWCSLYIAGYKNSRLITVGPYSISRNPLYFFSFIGGIGIGFTTETLLFAILSGFFCWFFYPGVIHSEEERLLALYGERFEAYCRETPAFFPKWSLLKEPDTYTVNPKIFRKNAFGVLWFVWMVGILEMIEALHEAGILPVLFILY
jgi:protein-S-isoprenylcysteine O-methyltransferase Ste14